MSEKMKDGKGYEIMPNSIKLFENKKKTKDTHPDYTGKYYDENGKEFYVSCWSIETKSGDIFLSGKVSDAEKINAEREKNQPEKPKSKKLDNKKEKSGASVPAGNADLDDDLPF